MNNAPAPGTLAVVLAEQAAMRGHSAALLDAEGGVRASYAQLWDDAQRAARCLHTRWPGAWPARVAVALPNGHAMARALLACTASATCLPLEPASTAPELRRQLVDGRVTHLVLGAHTDGALAALALELGVQPVECDALGRLPESGHDAPLRWPAPGDTALVLSTSGTTARPKRVPLTQANLLASAGNVARSLALGPADRCLNVMPLVHIHGLVGALLSTLVSGGSIACSSGFDASVFFGWLARSRATWYTAVPTIHQAVLAHAAGQTHALRLARSCSSALPPALMRDLEAALQVPVIEAYGMTEAAHQIASNALPPAQRVPGSVGFASGVDIAILDADGRHLPRGTSGEVAIRGPGVTAGYEDDDDANAAAFVDGWLRTGDQGRLDDDARLTLTGRLKEMINRGGDKIAPREIDEALLEHPDVAQAVAFGVPHATLGENVAAAVVLRPGATPDAPALLRFLQRSLSPHKLPSRVHFLAHLPTAASGKIQRRLVAQACAQCTLNDEDEAAAPAPSSPEELAIAAVWSRLLGIADVRATDNFVDLGGDSLLAMRATAEIEAACGLRIDPRRFPAETLEQLANRDTPSPASTPQERAAGWWQWLRRRFGGS